MKRYILIISVFFGAVACGGWLDLEPYDGVMEENYWQTKEDVNKFVIGLYTSLTHKDLTDRMITWGELRADFLAIGPNANSSHINVVRGEINPDNQIVIWSRFYFTINQCNKLIEQSASTREMDRTFTESLYRQYLAEATAIRSLMYFYLVRSFQDVPLVLKATDSDAQDLYPAKTEGHVILDTLVVQLTKSLNHLPTTYHKNSTNKGRITRYAAMALLSDIYLWQGNYTGCNDLCSQIIGSGQYSLIPLNREEVPVYNELDEVIDTVYYPNESDADYIFDQLYVTGNCVESIFEIQFPKEEQNLDGIIYPFFYNGGRPSFYANTENLDQQIFPDYQLDRSAYDIRGNNFSFKSSAKMVWKHNGLSRMGNVVRGNRQFANWIVYRLSDAMLMKAEALNQLGIQSGDQKMLEDAYGLVKTIRDRNNAVKSYDSRISYPIDGKALERLILYERAREFAFEGKRWYDVLRNARRDNYAGDNIKYLMEMAIFSAPPDKLLSLQSKYENKWFHYWPIYVNDVETNPALVQNDFYINFK